MQKKLILMLICLSLGTCGTAAQALAPTSAPRRVEISAKQFAFEPGVITLKKGEPVDLVLNSADVPHGLRIREIGLEVKCSKGKAGEVLFTPQKVGEFVGHCSVFCGAKHGSMTITVRVVA